jgi:putative ABC transport system permease protein
VRQEDGVRYEKAGALALALALIALSACGSADGGTRQFAEPPAGSYSVSVVQVTTDGSTEPLDGATVSRDFFTAAGVRPLVGRFFVDGDHRTKTPAVVVLNQAFWQRRFHGAPRVIGTTITVNDQPVTVIGVAERGFAAPRNAQVWLPKIEP